MREESERLWQVSTTTSAVGLPVIAGSSVTPPPLPPRQYDFTQPFAKPSSNQVVHSTLSTTDNALELDKAHSRANLEEKYEALEKRSPF